MRCIRFVGIFLRKNALACSLDPGTPGTALAPAATCPRPVAPRVAAGAAKDWGGIPRLAVADAITQARCLSSKPVSAASTAPSASMSERTDFVLAIYPPEI